MKQPLKSSMLLQPTLLGIWSLLSSTTFVSAQDVVYPNRRFVIHSLQSLVTARIDPLVNEGAVASHSHHVVGGSNFGTVYNPDKLRQSECTTFGVGADMSNYWQPQVFQINVNKTFVAMRTNTRVYYEQPYTLPGVEVEPFPYDFRMIAGRANRKSLAEQDTGERLQLYCCERFNQDGTLKSRKETFHLPTEPCTILIVKTWFPTCWNGNTYNASDPYAHVAYPNWGGNFVGENCPTGFERRLVNIHMETFYWRTHGEGIAAPPEGRPQFILANGDLTGYGLHADFQNGWDVDIQRKVLQECKTTPVVEPPEQACIHLAASANRTMGDKCRYKGKIPDEETGWGNVLRFLPGCNLPWWNGTKPECPPKVFNGDPDFIEPPSGMSWP